MDEAINSIRKALEIDPDKADAHYYLGVIYASNNKYNEAIEENKKVIAVDPNYANAHFNLGTIYHKQDLFNEAIEEYDKTIQIDRVVLRMLIIIRPRPWRSWAKMLKHVMNLRNSG